MTSQDTNDSAVSRGDRQLAYLLLRATLGVNILFHGLSRLLAGSEKFVATIEQQFRSTPLPGPLVSAFAHCLPWIEFAVGAFVLVGLFTRWALICGALVIIALTFGSTLHQDWDVAGLQLIYAIVYAALIAHLHANRYSADTLLARTSP